MSDDAVVLADGNETKTIRAIARDEDGDPLVGYTVALFCDDKAVQFVQPGVTDANGVATGKVKSLTPGDKWVQALVADASSVRTFGHGLRVTFTADANAPSPPSATNNASTLYLYTDSINVVADGNSKLTLSVAGRLKPGQTISLSSSNPNDALIPATGTLGPSGVLRATLTSTEAGARTLKATAGSLQRSLSAALLPGAPDANHCAATLSPNTAIADGMTPTNLWVTVADRFGNPIAYETVFLAASSPNVQYGSNSSMTDESGIYTVGITSTLAGTPNVTATFGASPNSISLCVQPNFIAGPVDAAQSMGNANAMPIDLGQSTIVSFTLKDATGNPVGNEPVAFSSASPNDLFAPTSMATDDNGLVESVFTPSIAGTRHVIANANMTSIGTQVVVRPTNANASMSSFVASPNTVTADANMTSVATLVIEDANQLPKANQSVTFSASDPNVILTPTSGLTDAQGSLSVSARSADPCWTLIEAQWPDATLATDVWFVPDPHP